MGGTKSTDNTQTGGDRAGMTSRLAWSFTVGVTSLLLAGAGVGVYWGYGKLRDRAVQLRPAQVSVKIAWPPLGGGSGGGGDYGGGGGGARDNRDAAKSAKSAARRGALPVSEPATDEQTWLTAPYRDRLTRLVESRLSADPYDQASLKGVHDELMATGWFKRLEPIRRDHDGVVRIRGEWRLPVAVVRSGDVDYLISSQGELMEPTFRPGSSGFPVIVGVPAAAPELGQPWPGDEVPSALSLIDVLQRIDTPDVPPGQSRVFKQVASIDASELAERRRLVLVTDRGNRVVWGSPVGKQTVPGEPTLGTKVNRLRDLARDPSFSRRIDAGLPWLDISNPAGVVIDRTARRALEGATESEPSAVTPVADPAPASQPRSTPAGRPGNPRGNAGASGAPVNGGAGSGAGNSGPVMPRPGARGGIASSRDSL